LPPQRNPEKTVSVHRDTCVVEERQQERKQERRPEPVPRESVA
jgi:hypothetical protein